MNRQKTINQLLHHLKSKGEKDRSRLISQAKKKGKKNVAKAVIACLEVQDPSVREAAVECLGHLGQDLAVPHLLKLLTDRSPSIRQYVIESLSLLLEDKKKCPPALLRKLRDANELVRIETAEALGQIGDKRVLPALWKAFNDRSSLVRSYIAGSIGELGSLKDVPKLQKALAREKSPRAKLGACQALYMLGQKEVFPLILKTLCNKDYRLRCATANSLKFWIVEEANVTQVLEALHTALKVEPTVAAKSTLRTSIRDIRKQFKD